MTEQQPAETRINKFLLTHKQAIQRKAQVLQVDYLLSLSLTEDSEYFSGQMIIDVELAPQNRLPLTVDFEAAELEQLKINGHLVSADYQGHFITIAANQLNPGKNVLQINYRHRYANNGTGFNRVVDKDNGKVYLYSDFQSYKANLMFPLFDQPDLKAHFTLDVLAPAQWQLISTTLETKVTAEQETKVTAEQKNQISTAEQETKVTTAQEIKQKPARKHWYFKQTPLIPSYVFSLHAGEYQLWQDNSTAIPLRLFARQGMGQYIDSKDWFTPTKQCLAFFSQYFDIDYPFEKYDQIIVPDYVESAMENVAAVTFNEDAYVSPHPLTIAQKNDLLDTIAHEMAHMWFGNLVTMQWWNGLWLNESFASFMAVVAMEKAMAMPDAWDTFHANFKQWGYITDQLVTTHPIELAIKDTNAADAIFDGITYGKGAAVVAQLARFVGENAFRQGVRQYLKKYSYQNTTLADFINELTKASHQDLNRWSQDWLYQAGTNHVRSEISCKDNVITQAMVYQQALPQWPTLRQHQLQLGLYYSNPTNHTQIELLQRYPFSIEGEKVEVVAAKGAKCPQFAFANVDDWGYVKVDLAPESLPFLTENLQRFPALTTRMMLWQSLWDQVNGLTLPLNEFIALAQQQLPLEREPLILTLANSFLTTAADYLAKNQSQTAQISALRLAIESLAWQQINQQPIARERQVISLDFITRVTHSPKGLAKVEQILQQKMLLTDLALDKMATWDLVFLLNRYQFGHYKALTAQAYQQLESPDQDLLYIADHVAADKTLKTQWLKLITDPSATADLDVLWWFMGYIFPSDQSVLYQHFQPSILAALPKLHATMNKPYLTNYANQMINGSCTPNSIKQLTKASQKYQNLDLNISNAIRVALQVDQRCWDIIHRMSE